MLSTVNVGHCSVPYGFDESISVDNLANQRVTTQRYARLYVGPIFDHNVRALSLARSAKACSRLGPAFPSYGNGQSIADLKDIREENHTFFVKPQ